MRFGRLLPKTLFVLIVLFAISIVVMAGFLSWTTDRSLTAEFQRNGEDIAESIASSTTDLVFDQDPTAIQALIDERREGIPGISYIFVQDEQGNVVAHTFVPSVPDEVLRLTGHPLKTTFHQVQVKGQGDSIDVCSAILSGQGGYVHVGMDREPIRIKILQGIGQMAGLMMLLFVVSAGTTVSLLRMLTRPLKQMTESAQRLAFGDTSVVGESPSPPARFLDDNDHDEVAELAQSFRRMAHEVSVREAGLKGRLKLLLDSTAEGIYGVDTDGMCTFCNSASAKLLGYERPEELIGHNMHNMLHHTRNDGSPCPLAECRFYQAAQKGEDKHADDEVFWRADGTSFPAEVWSNPIRENGQIVGCVVSFLDVTDRKRAADDLDGYLNHTPSMMIVAGFDGYVKKANSAVLKVGGWSSIDEVTAKPFLSFIHPDDRERVRAKLEQLLGGGSTQAFEARSRYQNGSYHWFSWSVTSFPDRQLIFATAQDVTERKESEEALHASENINRIISESALDAIVLMGPDGRIFHWNPAATKIFGYTREEILGRKLHETLVPPEFGERYRLGLKGFHKTGTGPLIGKTLELSAVHKDGHRFPLELSLNAVSIKGEWSAVGIVRDITERKLAEESLRLNVAAMEAAANGIAIFNVQGNLMWVNSAYSNLTGYSAEEAIGQIPRVLKSGHQTPEFYERMWNTITGGQIWHGELINHRKDGSLYDEEVTITPVRDATGEIRNFVAIKQDITPRKRAEEGLLDAKQAAESANRAKSQFLANMSHEIRTPMNGIIGLTELALDTQLTREQREYLSGVLLSAESLLKLINSILDFSKIEAGKLELERIDFDLREGLEMAMKTLSLRAHEKKLELLCEVRPNVPDSLIGDPARLRQVVINLVGNALKFTHHGEVALCVELDEASTGNPPSGADVSSVRIEAGDSSPSALASDSGSDRPSEPVASTPQRMEAPGTQDGSVRLHFSVRDTGVGIPASQQAQLFKPFTQADSSMTRQFGGTGLGLAISQHLVEMLGGRIWFESEEGHGSQFHFTMPFDLQADPVAMDHMLLPRDLAGLRVLVVDDNATNRRIQRDQLAHWGLNPTEAESGRAALQALQAAAEAHQPFGLILLDLIMPDLDGFSVLEQIHAMPEVFRPIIMMLSFVDDRGQMEHARELGVATYLVKPIGPLELRQAIVTALGIVNDTIARREAMLDAPAQPPGRALRILVAEDNALNRLLATRTLQKAGHSVEVAVDGAEAVAALGREPFDLVLMDVQMPVMDGFQATARIREQESGSGRHQPIVAMTAHALKEDRERCLEAGMDGYVSKPIRTGELFAAIAAATRGNSVPTVEVAAATVVARP